MNSKPNPYHQAETEFDGVLVEFTSPALLPDDPSLEPRVRRRRPTRSLERAEPTPADENSEPPQDAG